MKRIALGKKKKSAQEKVHDSIEKGLHEVYLIRAGKLKKNPIQQIQK